MARCFKVAALAALLVLAPAAAQAAPEATVTIEPCATQARTCVPVRVHVAAGALTPQHAADGWWPAQLAEARRHFALIEVDFAIVEVVAIDETFAEVATAETRFALAARGGPDVLDVFITGKLVDLDQPNAEIRGVAWRPRGGTALGKIVIVSTIARPMVLAHEFGHVFGLPHGRAAASIMNKTPRTEPPPEARSFTRSEQRTMRRTLARMQARDRFRSTAPPRTVRP